MDVFERLERVHPDLKRTTTGVPTVPVVSSIPSEISLAQFMMDEGVLDGQADVVVSGEIHRKLHILDSWRSDNICRVWPDFALRHWRENINGWDRAWVVERPWIEWHQWVLFATIAISEIPSQNGCTYAQSALFAARLTTLHLAVSLYSPS